MHRRELNLQVGDDVFLNLRSYSQRSFSRKRCEKLALKFYDPYKVVKKIGEAAYRLELPPKANICNVFHVSHLKLK